MYLQVLDAVVRLSNVYIKLMSAGCVLFADWHAKFLCDTERIVCAFVRFGTKDQQTPQLKGRRSERDDVGTIIAKPCKIYGKLLG